MRIQLTPRAFALVASVLTLAPSAHTQDAQDAPPSIRATLDANGDGALSASEIRGAPAALGRLDRDGDGALSGAEALELRPNRGRRGRRGGFGGASPGTPLDSNRDSSIDESERLAASATLRALDGNRDGQLSKDEFEHAFPPRELGGGFDMRAMRGGRRDTRSEPVLPQDLDPADGAAEVPDRASFERLAYRGDNVMMDTHLRQQKFVKFQVEGAGTAAPRIYFFNTKKWRAHPMFSSAMGLRGGRGFGRRGGRRDEIDPETGLSMRGVLVFRPMLRSPNGETGLFTFEFNPGDNYSFRWVKFAHDLLCSKSELLRGRLAYHPLERDEARTRSEAESYARAKLPIFYAADAYSDIAYLPLHAATSFGVLRELRGGERPGARDIVLCASLPNEMPRVAGILTAVRQTPLSHVNLRAVQDDVPNAYVRGITDKPELRALLGKYVSLRVDASGYELREVSKDEVDAHFAGLRPSEPQVPERRLDVDEIRSLGEIGHDDWPIYGVKAANLAVLRSLELPCKTVRIGFAVPFAFYDGFMKHNRFYEAARRMIASEGFASDPDARRAALASFRAQIAKGELPRRMMDALAQLQRNFGDDESIRCRSSTNNEDLPKFSGAGLYDSFTHRPEEGHLAKSIRQVWASLWNFRAFEERSFYRIDHFATAMGVLCHPNFEGERANGVAVSADVVYGSEDKFYVNVRPGEDLVTNPEAASQPEEALLSPRDFRGDRTIRFADDFPEKSLLGGVHTDDLREALAMIDAKFRRVYGLLPQALFAMEVEFKVTAKGRLAIKQARPWIY